MGVSNYLPPELQGALKLAQTGVNAAKGIYFPGNSQAATQQTGNSPSPFYPGWVVDQLIKGVQGGKIDPGAIGAAGNKPGSKSKVAQYHLPTDPYQQMIMDTISKMRGGGSLSAPMVDPKAYAGDAAGAQYDAAISQLQHQLAQAPVDTRSHQHDIKSWFANALGSYNQGAKGYKQNLASELSGLDKASQGFIGAVGGGSNPAAYGLTQQGMNAHAGLAGLGLANTRFDKEMAGIIPLQGAQEHINEQNRGVRLAQELSNSLLSTKKEKGQVYAKTLADANQQNFQNQFNLNTQNQQKQQGILSAELQGSQIGASRAAAEANVNLTNSRIAAQKAATKASTSGVNSNTLANPSVTAGLEKAVIGAISGAKGGLVVDPRTAWQTTNAIISRYGFKGPRAQALAESIFNQVLGTSKAHHQFTGTTMGPNGPHTRTHIPKKK